MKKKPDEPRMVVDRPGGQTLIGWVIRKSDGTPRYLQIDGEGGLCIPWNDSFKIGRMVQ